MRRYFNAKIRNVPKLDNWGTVSIDQSRHGWYERLGENPKQGGACLRKSQSLRLLIENPLEWYRYQSEVVKEQKDIQP